MLAGAALVPAAPLLLAAVTPALPSELEPVRSGCRAALASLGGDRLAVLVAAGARAGVHGAAHASLAGCGRPDVAADLPVPPRAARALSEATGLGRVSGPLPLDLAVLALQLERPVVPVAVDAAADGQALARLGEALGEALADASLTAVVVAAADGSAALSPWSPRPGVDGACAWQEAFEGAVGAGDVAALAGLGPAAAERVAARGWAPSLVASAASAGAGLRPSVTVRAAPRGVGYLIATLSDAR